MSMTLDQESLGRLKSQEDKKTAKVLVVADDKSIVISDAKGAPLVISAATAKGMPKVKTGDELIFDNTGSFVQVTEKLSKPVKPARGAGSSFNHIANRKMA